MAKNVFTNLDLNKNQLVNAVIHQASTAPSSPVAGQLWFDTTASVNALKVYDGTNWIKASAEISGTNVSDGVNSINGLLNLGDGTNIREWATGTAYHKGDVVMFINDIKNFGLYICVSDHTSTTVADDIETKWTSLDINNYTFGDWAASTYYAMNAIILRSGAYYMNVGGARKSGTSWDTTEAGYWIKLNTASITTDTSTITIDGTSMNDILHLRGATDLSEAMWTPGMSCKPGDVVIFQYSTSTVRNTIVYVCYAADSDSAGDTMPAPNKFVVLSLNNWIKWVENDWYEAGQIVEYPINSNDIYVSNTRVQAIIGQEPSTYDNGWTLIARGAQYQGDWATSTLYQKNDMVKKDGVIYICNERHTSGSWDATELSKWNDIGVSGSVSTTENKVTIGNNSLSDLMLYKGAWAENTAYKKGDLVINGTSIYVCNTAHTSATGTGAALDTDKFDLLEKQHWRGTWTAGTKYLVDDVVTYGSGTDTATYICTTANTDAAWTAGHWQVLGGGTGVVAGAKALYGSVDVSFNVDSSHNIELALDKGLAATDVTVGSRTSTIKGIALNFDQTSASAPSPITFTKNSTDNSATLGLAYASGTNVTLSTDTTDADNPKLKAVASDATAATAGVVKLTESYVNTEGVSDLKAITGKGVKAAIDSLDVTEFALGSKEASTNIITLKGITEVDGLIAAGTDTTKDIAFAAVAATGKAQDVTVDNGTKTYMQANVQAELEKVYANEQVTIATAATPSTGSKTTYEIKQTGSGLTTGDGAKLDTTIEIPELTLTKDSTASTGMAATYTLSYGGTALATKIDIPQDWLLKYAWSNAVKTYDSTAGASQGDLLIDPATASGTAATVYAAKADIAAGTSWADAQTASINSGKTAKAGDKYLCLFMNIEAGTAESKLILVSLSDLGATYTASDGITLDGTNFKHSNSITSIDTAHVVVGKYDAQGHLKEYEATYAAQVKKTAGTLAVGSTSVEVAIPAADAGNANFDYMYTRTFVSGAECVTDVAWDSTNKKITVSIAQAIASAIDVVVYYSIA